ncbi:hypothetical protein VT84_23440 [Gemmata sp. SH-PL17]|uniref:hypothetical protein n=1 Tax=Gemmata sp. SH-PL17 TaxID=1630693 RepID=UPI00078B8F63|nr:hypothetical protein [Gemmata sp. SH-PL17]AMV27373.1 hypothetical protein VT84_23440 [Gemmata sp. SH-PL17]
MSERSAALGIKGPPKVIEHNGKTYTVAPVLTHGTMLAVETKLYERAKAALLELRDVYPADEYLKRADELRKQRETGHFAFESEHTMAFLETTPGTALLLSCMMSAEPAEIFELLAHKPEEMRTILTEVMEDSLPKEALAPKRKAPGPDLARRNRGRR